MPESMDDVSPVPEIMEKASPVSESLLETVGKTVLLSLISRAIPPVTKDLPLKLPQQPETLWTTPVISGTVPCHKLLPYEAWTGCQGLQVGVCRIEDVIQRLAIKGGWYCH